MLQLSTLIGELASAGEAELKVQLDDGVMERLLAYSRSVASFPTAVKEASLCLLIPRTRSLKPYLRTVCRMQIHQASEFQKGLFVQHPYVINASQLTYQSFLHVPW